MNQNAIDSGSPRDSICSKTALVVEILTLGSLFQALAVDVVGVGYAPIGDMRTEFLHSLL